MINPPAPLPPHNIEAEQALLGALLVNNKAFDLVAETLQPEHFYDAAHATIYTLICKQLSAGQSVSPITLQHLCTGPEFAVWNGAGYLAQLAASVITVVNSADYARTIRELYQRRQLLELAQAAAHDAVAAEDLGAVLAQLHDRVGEVLGAAVPQNTFYTMAQAVHATLEWIGRRWRGEEVFLQTGYGALDALLKLRPGSLTVIGARPGMGKTALAGNVAFRHAKAGKQICFFTMEMTHKEITQRFWAIAAEVNYHKIDNATPDDAEMISRAAGLVRDLPLYIEDATNVGLPLIESRAREVKRKYGLDCIVVDYLGLMAVDERDRNMGKVYQIQAITQGLKRLAKQLGIPVILLAQLNRGVEGREDKTPQISDLRDSGSIEQDADNIIFIHRPEYYLQQSEPIQRENEDKQKFAQRYVDWETLLDQWKGIARIIIAKQRNGPTGSIKLAWRGAEMIFDDLAG